MGDALREVDVKWLLYDHDSGRLETQVARRPRPRTCTCLEAMRHAQAMCMCMHCIPCTTHAVHTLLHSLLHTQRVPAHCAQGGLVLVLHAEGRARRAAALYQLARACRVEWAGRRCEGPAGLCRRWMVHLCAGLTGRRRR